MFACTSAWAQTEYDARNEGMVLTAGIKYSNTVKRSNRRAGSGRRWHCQPIHTYKQAPDEAVAEMSKWQGPTDLGAGVTEK